MGRHSPSRQFELRCGDVRLRVAVELCSAFSGAEVEHFFGVLRYMRRRLPRQRHAADGIDHIIDWVHVTSLRQARAGD